MTLEQYLAEVYRLKANRQESDIGMSDPYWKALERFRQEHAAASHIHVDSAIAKEIAKGEITEAEVLDN